MRMGKYSTRVLKVYELPRVLAYRLMQVRPCTFQACCTSACFTLACEYTFLSSLEVRKRGAAIDSVLLGPARICILNNRSYSLGYDGSLLNGLQAIPAWQADFGKPTGYTLGLIAGEYSSFGSSFRFICPADGPFVY